MKDTTEQRFWSRILGDIATGCWLWTGTRHTQGYGHLSIGSGAGRLVRAHRFSWTLHYGPIPEGLLVLHRCDVPACVRPDHLFLGTHLDNTRDAATKGRWPERLSDQHKAKISESRRRAWQLAKANKTEQDLVGLRASEPAT